MGYFHHYEYRHLLRGPDCYREWSDIEVHPLTWNKLYKDIELAFINAGLDPEGYSLAHTAIIDSILKLKGKAIKVYHGSTHGL